MKTINFKFIYKTKNGNIKKSDRICWTCDCDCFLNKVNNKSYEEYLEEAKQMWPQYKKYWRGELINIEILESRGF